MRAFYGISLDSASLVVWRFSSATRQAIFLFPEISKKGGMPLSVDIKPIAETDAEIPRFAEWLQQVLKAIRQVWAKEKSPEKTNRRSRPAKIIERR